ncbi:hypothetical protein BDZ97DRAFT_1762971 [Flammula alnicola]|nr:hypothetical protein BDZ97DRAFT_1762971 [Flammula alnicola]
MAIKNSEPTTQQLSAVSTERALHEKESISSHTLVHFESKEEGDPGLSGKERANIHRPENRLQQQQDTNYLVGAQKPMQIKKTCIYTIGYSKIRYIPRPHLNAIGPLPQLRQQIISRKGGPRRAQKRTPMINALGGREVWEVELQKWARTHVHGGDPRYAWTWMTSVCREGERYEM